MEFSPPEPFEQLHALFTWVRSRNIPGIPWIILGMVEFWGCQESRYSKGSGGLSETGGWAMIGLSGLTFDDERDKEIEG